MYNTTLECDLQNNNYIDKCNNKKTSLKIDKIKNKWCQLAVTFFSFYYTYHNSSVFQLVPTLKGSQTAVNSHLHAASNLVNKSHNSLQGINFCFAYGSEVETIHKEHTSFVTYTSIVMYSEISSSAFDSSSPKLSIFTCAKILQCGQNHTRLETQIFTFPTLMHTFCKLNMQAQRDQTLTCFFMFRRLPLTASFRSLTESLL